MSKNEKKDNSITRNRKAFHDYEILETLEAGIVLVGTEVKSIRQGHVNLKESWVSIENDEAFVLGMHISPYDHGNIYNLNPIRKRKLLLHKMQIRRLEGQVAREGMTLVPLSLYFSRSNVKMGDRRCKKVKNSTINAETSQKETMKEVWRERSKNMADNYTFSIITA